VNAKKRCLINRLPQTLIIHLKRFEYDLESGRRRKVTQYCQFPEVIDMAPYTVQGNREDYNNSNNNNYNANEQRQREDGMGMCDGSEATEQREDGMGMCDGSEATEQSPCGGGGDRQEKYAD
jgi:hypothetical protein